MPLPVWILFWLPFLLLMQLPFTLPVAFPKGRAQKFRAPVKLATAGPLGAPFRPRCHHFKDHLTYLVSFMNNYQFHERKIPSRIVGALFNIV